ncbi:MAG: creatininase family protein [Lachnospiraceae bacterium]|nr:creatininase family protein [Lachnospiraceae bacterium]
MVRYYRELTRLEMEQVDKAETIVLIPIGALEQHGNQCPLGTDEIISEATARRIKEALDREIPDYPMLIFPPLPVGLSTEHINFCGSITLKPETLYRMLYDICKSLQRHGFKKIAMLNCHGGNSPIIQILSRELRSECGLAVFNINCGVFFGNQAVKDTVTPGNIWDFHGGEMETSMVLAERPELVKLATSEAGVPRKFIGNKTFTVYGPITIGWVSEEWETEDRKPIGIGGDPSGATAEKGEQIYESFVESIVAGLKEIRRWKD